MTQLIIINYLKIQTKTNMKILIACIIFTLFLAPKLGQFATFTNESDLMRHLPTLSEGMLPYNEDKPFYLSDKKLVSEFVGEVSAYTLGREEENDSTPCIGAFNENLCLTTDLVFANNFYDKGTLVCVDKVGCGRVADRMNARYGKEHFDIAGMNLKENLKFGRQNLIVRVYKK